MRLSRNVLAIGLAIVGLLAAPRTGRAQQFSAWSQPVNLGPVVNSIYNDQHPAISPDDLSLYFASNRPGGFGSFDIWVSHRASVDNPWGPPQNLGSNINTELAEFAPTLSNDGHLLFFGTDRPAGSCGSRDIWVSFRQSTDDDFDWEPPVDLGCVVNSGYFDDGPTYFVDDDTGLVTLYFTSNRPGGLGIDIWSSTENPDGSFDSPIDVVALNSAASDTRTTIRHDGLEMILTSDRTGSLGSRDLWVSTRPSTSAPWTTPVNLGPPVNTVYDDGAPALSKDATTLYFYSNRPGGFGLNDLYVTTRQKIKGTN
jgi:WD40 repeat protein